MADSSTTARLRQEVSDLEAEIKNLRANPPGSDAEPSQIEAYNRSLTTAKDDYRQALNNLHQAEVLDRQQAEKDAKAGVSAERKAAAQKRLDEAKNRPPSARKQTANEFLQDLEDLLAVGQITDAEASRRYETFKYENYTKPQEDAQANRQAQQETRASSREDRLTDTAVAAEGRAQRNEGRQLSNDARVAANDASRISLDQRRYARESGTQAVERAVKQRATRSEDAYARARAAGKSPQEALAAANAEPDLDLDDIASRAVDRELAAMGFGPAQREPGRTAANPAPASTPPAGAPVPGATPQAAAAQRLGSAQAAGTLAPPPVALDPYKREEVALGRFGR